MDRAVLSSNEIVVTSVVGWEVNRETSSIDEGHTAGLLLVNGASIDILLVGLRLSLQLLQIAVLKALLHGPLNDAAISRDRDKSFSFVFALYPLDFPNDISVFVGDIFRGGEGEIVLGVSHIEY